MGQMALVEVSTGVRLYVEEFGDGPPVVFVHGGGVTHAFWEHQVAGLMDRFRTITFDLRGCGASDKPSTGYSVEIWAEDLYALIERLELERPTIVGHALGSHVGLRLAATHPEAVDRLVLTAAAPWFLGDRDQEGGFSEDFWKQLQASWLRNRPQSELDLLDQKYFHEDPGEGIRMATLQMALTWPLPVFIELAKTLPELDHRDALPGIELPILLLHGRHDRKNRYDGGAYLAEHLPNARLITFEKSAHCLPLEEPRRCNEALLEFLGEPTASVRARQPVEG
jgi:non-heme chloroperoxidase